MTDREKYREGKMKRTQGKGSEREQEIQKGKKGRKTYCIRDQRERRTCKQKSKSKKKEPET